MYAHPRKVADKSRVRASSRRSAAKKQSRGFIGCWRADALRRYSKLAWPASSLIFPTIELFPFVFGRYNKIYDVNVSRKTLNRTFVPRARVSSRKMIEDSRRRSIQGQVKRDETNLRSRSRTRLPYSYFAFPIVGSFYGHTRCVRVEG